MRRFSRFLVFTLAIVVVVALLLFGAITRTDFARERVRRVALSFLGDIARGTVRIGRIEGNVLGAFTLVDVSIADSTGAPLFQVDRLAAHLDSWGLLKSRIALSDVVLSRPVIHLTQSADGTWNYERIFPRGEGTPGDTASGLGDWITMRNVTLRDGDLQVVRPWVPDESLSPAARDSLVREALHGRTRLRIASVEAGFTQHMAFTAINGHIVEATIADPDDRDVRAQVDSLALIAAPFNPPPLDVRHFAGNVRAGQDSVSIPNLVLRLPATDATGTLTYMVASGDLLATLDVPRVAFADVRTLYLPLPDSGTGRMQLQLAMRDSGTSEYIVQQALVTAGTARAEGDISIAIDSVVRFPSADLRLRRLSSALVEQLVPGLDIPVDGEATGRAKFSGSVDAMRVDVNAQVEAYRHPAFGFTARGGVGFGEVMRADRLFVRADRVPLSLLREFDTESPVGGLVSVEGTVGGSMAGRMSGSMSIVHTEGQNLSRALVEGSVMPRDGNRLDLVANVQRLDLDLIEHFVDSVDVVGQTHGRVTAKGPTNDLVVTADLVLPGRGRLTADGTIRTLAGDTLDYAAKVAVFDFAPQAMVPALPIMIVDGETTIAGRGTDPATLRAEVDSRLKLFMIDSAEFRDVAVVARAADGVLQVDTLSAKASFGSVTADGRLGLVEGKDGTMRFHAQVSDLGGLTRWIATGDTGVVPARPAIRARIARLRERADSLRLAQRAANDPAAELAADLQRPERRRRRRAPIDVPPVGRDSISGSFDVAGEARGHVKDLDVNATVSTPGFVWGGNAVGAGRLVTRWVGIGTPNDTAHAQGGFAALRAAGFEFDSTQLKADYHRGAGTAQVVIFPGDTAVYRLEAAYLVHGNEGEVHLNDMRLQLDSTTWRLAHPGAVSWRGQGLTIDSLELLDAGGARIAINGELPDVDPGRLEVHLERVRIAPWLAILQSDVLVDGLLDVRGTWDGTRRDPRIDGTVALRTPTYNGTPFPELHTTLAYAARQMRVDAAIRRDTGLELATITGTVPIDLTLGDSLATRLLESTPLALVIEGDSIPLSPIMEFTDAVTELTGRAFGRVEVAGTWGKPDLSGGLGLDIPRVRLTSTGVLMQQVAAALHMSGDTMVVDSLLGHSRGTLRGKGNVVFTSLANPTLDLTFDAAEVRVLDDERGELQATGTIAAKGPLDTLAVTGSMAITRGVIYIPDPEQFDVIATDDPAIFAVTDTATAQALGLEVPSPILRNLRLDVDIDVRRGTFGRSPDANVEVYGKLEVRTEPGVDAYLVKGALFTDQGTYTFLGKRFDVSRGSVRFLGGDEELNPALQILARYEVRQAGRAPLDIRVIIGGTLDRPTVSLESDAQPPLSQSDLIAFLAFGRSSSSLLGSSGSGLEGGGAGGSSLAGNVRALATKQLASVALGVLVDEAKSGLATRTGADVLHITPAELPAELSLGTFQTLLRGTELEIGKYLDRHTFLIGRIRPSLAVPGASLEHRLNERLSVRGTVETRYQSQPPSLSAGLAPRTIQLVGALLTWRIGW